MLRGEKNIYVELSFSSETPNSVTEKKKIPDADLRFPSCSAASMKVLFPLRSIAILFPT